MNNLTNRLLKMALDIETSLSKMNCDMLESDAPLTDKQEALLKENQQEELELAKFRKALKSGTDYDKMIMLRFIDGILESEYQ